MAVLPEAEDVEVEIDPNDLQIDVYRSSGPGGQSVNTTDSAVRITHKPSGIVVSMQDEKSQLQNRERAMRVLRARLYERALAEQQAALGASRLAQVGTGDRAEKIRTYNYGERRVKDHRINLLVHNLDEILLGELGELTDALQDDRSAAGWKSVPRADGGVAPATVGAVLAAGAARLAAAGVDTARLDAELLLGSVLDADRGRLVIDRDVAVESAARDRLEALLVRREAREPVAYILGRRAFRRLELSVDRRVLIPRPETELLVEVGALTGVGSAGGRRRDRQRGGRPRAQGRASRPVRLWR